MSSKVLDGAKIFCNKGTTSSQLKVLSQQIVKTDEKFVATETDMQAMVNILPFGVCSITQKTCVPSPIKWIKTHDKDTINNQKILLDSSECSCGLGGKIKPIHTNYNGFASYE